MPNRVKEPVRSPAYVIPTERSEEVSRRPKGRLSRSCRSLTLRSAATKGSCTGVAPWRGSRGFEAVLRRIPRYARDDRITRSPTCVIPNERTFCHPERAKRGGILFLASSLPKSLRRYAHQDDKNCPFGRLPTALFWARHARFSIKTGFTHFSGGVESSNHPSLKSSQFGFSFDISAFFFSRRQPFISFSLEMAS
ncbi:MAG: hypothetical protein BWY99_02684 [Synergistetes bacterium ADurb.BinA166]|nr:MAG: hypothetical protein BWY99_02684 [Synergistetes bacterium ADurb.BinA166]